VQAFLNEKLDAGFLLGARLVELQGFLEREEGDCEPSASKLLELLEVARLFALPESDDDWALLLEVIASKQWGMGLVKVVVHMKDVLQVHCSMACIVLCILLRNKRTAVRPCDVNEDVRRYAIDAGAVTYAQFAVRYYNAYPEDFARVEWPIQFSQHGGLAPFCKVANAVIDLLEGAPEEAPSEA